MFFLGSNQAINLKQLLPHLPSRSMGVENRQTCTGEAEMGILRLHEDNDGSFFRATPLLCIKLNSIHGESDSVWKIGGC